MAAARKTATGRRMGSVCLCLTLPVLQGMENVLLPPRPAQLFCCTQADSHPGEMILEEAHPAKYLFY